MVVHLLVVVSSLSCVKNYFLYYSHSTARYVNRNWRCDASVIQICGRPAGSTWAAMQALAPLQYSTWTWANGAHFSYFVNALWNCVDEQNRTNALSVARMHRMELGLHTYLVVSVSVAVEDNNMINKIADNRWTDTMGQKLFRSHSGECNRTVSAT